MCFDVGGVDHLRVRRSPVPGELSEQLFPYAAPSPPSEAIVDRRGRPVGFGTIGPTAAALQHVNVAADNPAIVLPLVTLPSIKGAVVGLQWANRMYGFDPANRAQDPGMASYP